MELRGILIEKSEKQTFENNFVKQEFYLDCKRFNTFTGVPIENVVKFQATKSEALDALSKLEIGQTVIVSFSVKGRFFEKDGAERVHIQKLDVWKIGVINN